MHKQNGSLQILYERGWINCHVNHKEYTLLRSIDIYGNRNDKKSIKRLISIQPNFMNQHTLLQTYCTKLGIKSNQTQVEHCKITDEGIEFDCGFYKIVYQSKSLEEKRNKDKCQKLVKTVLSKDVLTLSVFRANAHRAKQYMLAYVACDAQKEQQTSNKNAQTAEHEKHEDIIHMTGPNKGDKEKVKVTHSLIETCVGLFWKWRSYCNMMDFDG